MTLFYDLYPLTFIAVTLVLRDVLQIYLLKAIFSFLPIFALCIVIYRTKLMLWFEGVSLNVSCVMDCHSAEHGAPSSPLPQPDVALVEKLPGKETLAQL